MIIAAISWFSAMGQSIPTSDDELINNYISSTMSIKKEKLESESLARVFNGSFYKATPAYSRNGGTATCEVYNVVIMNGKLAELEEITETKTMDQMFSLLKKDFTIKGESDAKIFEEALDAIYPLGWSDDAGDKKHFFKDGKWYFLRGTFFDSKKAFILTLNQSSAISQIEYNLEAVKGE